MLEHTTLWRWALRLTSSCTFLVENHPTTAPASFKPKDHFHWKIVMKQEAFMTLNTIFQFLAGLIFWRQTEGENKIPASEKYTSSCKNSLPRNEAWGSSVLVTHRVWAEPPMEGHGCNQFTGNCWLLKIGLTVKTFITGRTKSLLIDPV